MPSRKWAPSSSLAASLAAPCRRYECGEPGLAPAGPASLIVGLAELDSHCLLFSANEFSRLGLEMAAKSGRLSRATSVRPLIVQPEWPLGPAWNLSLVGELVLFARLAQKSARRAAMSGARAPARLFSKLVPLLGDHLSGLLNLFGWRRRKPLKGCAEVVGRRRRRRMQIYSRRRSYRLQRPCWPPEPELELEPPPPPPPTTTAPPTARLGARSSTAKATTTMAAEMPHSIGTGCSGNAENHFNRLLARSGSFLSSAPSAARWKPNNSVGAREKEK